MPQSDLLQHPKTKAFLTHGGYNSLQEAINAGKPLVTIGLFGDQPKNEKIAKKHGFAVNLSKANFTAEAVYDALTEVLENPRQVLRIQRQKTSGTCPQLNDSRPWLPKDPFLLNNF